MGVLISQGRGRLAAQGDEIALKGDRDECAIEFGEVFGSVVQ